VGVFQRQLGLADTAEAEQRLRNDDGDAGREPVTQPFEDNATAGEVGVALLEIPDRRQGAREPRTGPPAGTGRGVDADRTEQELPGSNRGGAGELDPAAGRCTAPRAGCCRCGGRPFGTSFAAVGARAAELLSVHHTDCHLGEDSPLAALAAADAATLLLGVGFEKATAFHLAEYRVPAPATRTYSCAVLAPDGGRRWIEYRDVVLDDHDFGHLGAGLELDTTLVTRGRIGAADSRLFPIAGAVTYAEEWLVKNR
jgi:hypothetical protein